MNELAREEIKNGELRLREFIIYDYIKDGSSYAETNLNKLLDDNDDFNVVILSYVEKDIVISNEIKGYNGTIKPQETASVYEINNIEFLKYKGGVVFKSIEVTDNFVINHLTKKGNFNKPMNTTNTYYFDFDSLNNENMKKILKRYFFLLEDNLETESDTKKDLNKDNRNENEKCRDRILYSKSFRRLGDKAQIFTSSKGDHYRNRLSHSLEVANITKSVIKELNMKIDIETLEKYNLCSYLGEAMALAHDIGHTPFGHVGEREIKKFLEEQFKYNKDPLKFIHFKHNLQSVRIIESIEECYIEEKGLKLNKEIILGVLFHTKLPYFEDVEVLTNYLNMYYLKGKNKISKEDFSYEVCNCKSIIAYKENEGKLESLIVSLSDEIAQKSHDIDDAIASKIISIDDLINYLDNYALNSKNTELTNLVELLKDIKEIDEFNIYDKENIYRSRVSSKIVNILVESLVDGISSKKNGFTDYGNKTVQLLDDVINKRVIKSSEVSKFDNKGSFVVKKLLNLYLNNLTYLPVSYRKRITIELFKHDPAHAFDLEVIDLELSIKLNEILSINSRIESKDGTIEDDLNYAQRKIIIQTVVDYVAGMSDNYALERYKEYIL